MYVYICAYTYIVSYAALQVRFSELAPFVPSQLVVDAGSIGTWLLAPAQECLRRPLYIPVYMPVYVYIHTGTLKFSIIHTHISIYICISVAILAQANLAQAVGLQIVFLQSTLGNKNSSVALTAAGISVDGPDALVLSNSDLEDYETTAAEQEIPPWVRWAALTTQVTVLRNAVDIRSHTLVFSTYASCSRSISLELRKSLQLHLRQQLWQSVPKVRLCG